MLAQPGLESGDGGAGSMHAIGRAWLGLTTAAAEALFTPDSEKVDYGAVTPAIAADVLDHLRETGEVVWPREVAGDDEA
jgi:thiamine biosynthesis protein ThiC